MAVFSPHAPAIPRPRTPAAALLAAAGRACRRIATAAVLPHRAALANLRAIPLTAAGAASIDFAAFHIGHGWGWLATGISLVILEHIIADER